RALHAPGDAGVVHLLRAERADCRVDRGVGQPRALGGLHRFDLVPRDGPSLRRRVGGAPPSLSGSALMFDHPASQLLGWSDERPVTWAELQGRAAALSLAQ